MNQSARGRAQGERRALKAPIVLLALAVAIPFSLVDAASGGLGWDVTLTYEINDENGNIAFSTEGLYTHVIHCDQDWLETHRSASSTPASDHVVDFSLSYTRGEIRASETVNGTVLAVIIACAEPSLVAVGGVTSAWTEREAASKGITLSSCDGQNFAGADFLSPNPLNAEFPLPIETSVDGVCLKARGGGLGGSTIPFTGRVTGEVDGHGDGYLRVFVCDMIAGQCTGGGSTFAGAALDCPNFVVPCFWTLRCKSEEFRHLGITPVGHFGCHVRLSPD